MEGLPYEYLRWIETDDGEPVKKNRIILGTDVKLVEDYKGNQLLLFGSQWAIGWTEERNKNLTFHEFRGYQVLIKSKTAPRPAPGGGFLPRRLPHGGVAEGGFLIRGLQLEDNGPQAVITTTNGHAGLANPVFPSSNSPSPRRGPGRRRTGRPPSTPRHRSPPAWRSRRKRPALPRSMGQAVSPSAPYSCARSRSRVVFRTVIFTRFITIPPRVRIG